MQSYKTLNFRYLLHQSRPHGPSCGGLRIWFVASVRSRFDDPVYIGKVAVKSIEAILKGNELENKHTTGNPDGQPKNSNTGINLLTKKIPESYCDIMSYHMRYA